MQHTCGAGRSSPAIHAHDPTIAVTCETLCLWYALSVAVAAVPIFITNDTELHCDAGGCGYVSTLSSVGRWHGPA